MKKIYIFFVLFLFLAVFCFFNLGEKSGYAENKDKIILKGVVRGAGDPNFLGGANWVAVSGNYAFVVSYDDNMLSAFDVSDPSNPTIASGIKIQGYTDKDWGAFSVFISGNYAFVYDDGGVLLIYDISDHVNTGPKLKSKIKIGPMEQYQDVESAWGYAFVSGNYAYTVDEVMNTLSIIDISDKNKPVILGTISGAGEPNYLKYPDFVTVDGNYAYVTGGGDDALSIFNISDPKKPVFTGVIRGKGDPNYLGGTNSVAINGNYAYVVSYDDAALSIIDISDPSNPILKGVIRGEGQPNYLESAIDVVLVNNYAFVASSANNAISVYDVVDPTNPILKDVIRGAGSPNYLKDVNSLEISGNYLYATAFSDNALVIFDISSFVNGKRSTDEPNIDNSADNGEEIITPDDSNTSALRKWLRIHNPYST